VLGRACNAHSQRSHHQPRYAAISLRLLSVGQKLSSESRSSDLVFSRGLKVVGRRCTDDWGDQVTHWMSVSWTCRRPPCKWTPPPSAWRYIRTWLLYRCTPARTSSSLCQLGRYTSRSFAFSSWNFSLDEIPFHARLLYNTLWWIVRPLVV